ncbi:unnamed protein product [Leptidea sinapis]|uniref:Odorant receptor n=1 Tax=Leptidea sinapis TaxID=189913 RepID=A0A5E4QXU8_9NEOP|nr:unnamed protein product [Leptidea sinapis]
MSKTSLTMSEDIAGIPSFDEIFQQIKINFTIIGIPFDGKVKIRFYLLILWLSIVISQELLFFVSKFSAENFLELTNLAPCTCIGLLSILKIIFIGIKRKNIFELTKSLQVLYEHIINGDSNTTRVTSQFVFLKYLIKYFFILNALLITVYNFSSPIIMLIHYMTKNRVHYLFPYAIVVPFTIDSWYKWLLMYLHSIICGFICALYFTTIDALYFILTTHVCCQFIILSEEIRTLTPETTNSLQDIIKKHQFILKLSQDLNEIFTAPNLFNVLVGSIGSWTQIPGALLFLSSVLLQILMISIFGENLIRESRNIGSLAFSCKWYDMDQKSKKTILLLMLRANKAQTLTAYKFSIISYESFTKIFI